MDPFQTENFIFIPESQGPGGTLYELSPSTHFQSGSFILLPYSDPQVKKTDGLFYRIERKIRIEQFPIPDKLSAPPSLTLSPVQSKADYLEQVRALKHHIQLGNIYEINYCTRFFAEAVEINPLHTFAKLHQLTKAPYSALVKLGEQFIISASPELFLQKKNGFIFTKPIKGTIRRGKTATEDAELKKNLYESQKERRENVMAVDVARNDLSQFAKRGTVQVNKLYNIETFETVHQMVSAVSCEPRENTSFETIINSAFPMASMTGAPKLMAMQFIRQYERFERHFYSGAMGLVDDEGDFTLSVTIRSIFYNRHTKQLSIAVGSAITDLSEPEQEYEECLLKANALLKALHGHIG